MKNSNDTRIELANFRLVPQCLNQLRYGVPERERERGVFYLKTLLIDKTGLLAHPPPPKKKTFKPISGYGLRCELAEGRI